MTLWPDGTPWPSVVLEVGYSETWPDLLADKHHWSVGSGNQINVIILVKIYLADMAGRVKPGLKSARSPNKDWKIYSLRLIITFFGGVSHWLT